MLLGALTFTQAFAADHDPKNIIPLLKTAKMTLLEGIEYSEKTSGVATSAKFEVDNGKLMLSVYTIPEGFGVEPEKATLTEISGSADDDLTKLTAEVFADREHIARATVHMTLFQLSKLSLKEVIERALNEQCGTPIDVRNPIVRNHRPVADVIIVDEYQSVFTVTVDLLNGKTSVQKQ